MTTPRSYHSGRTGVAYGRLPGPPPSADLDLDRQDVADHRIPAVVSRFIGWVRPRGSVARAMRTWRPGDPGLPVVLPEPPGVSHRLAHSFASAQVLPPSSLTSTFATSDSPAHAAPCIRYSSPWHHLVGGRAGDLGLHLDVGHGHQRGQAGRRAQVEYMNVWKKPSKGRSVTITRFSHFTDAMPYQPATTARTGWPCRGRSGLPFIA